MPDAELDNLFRAAFARDKNTQVVLKADKGVAHGRVVNLMERAKQAGPHAARDRHRGGEPLTASALTAQRRCLQQRRSVASTSTRRWSCRSAPTARSAGAFARSTHSTTLRAPSA